MIRQCACSVDVVDELPIIDVKYLLVNNTEVTLSNKSTVYNAQVHRGEEYVENFPFLTIDKRE